MSTRLVVFAAIGVVTLAVAIGAGLFALTRAPAERSRASSVSVGTAAPDFALEDLTTGRRVRLSDYRGRVVILNFWATWCGPCRFELPALEQMYAGRGAEDFVVLAVNVREAPAAVAAFRKDYRMTFPVLLDRTGETQRAYGEDVLPKTFFIGRDGVVRGRHIGSLGPADLARGLQFASE